MDFISLLMIAVGLAMDAFAVSVANGITVKNFDKTLAIRQGVFFGAFQALMTSAGWFVGLGLKEYIERFMTRPLRNLLTGSKELDKEFSLSDSEE